VRKIIQPLRFYARELLVLDFDAESITCTPRHRFFTDSWTPAYLLAKGDRILRSDGNWQPLKAASKIVHPQPVYNLHVEDLHNYFVGSCGLLVHNKKDLIEDWD
jgi:intein/homing endonuclease